MAEKEDDADKDTPKTGLPPFVPNQSVDAANMAVIQAHHRNATVALTGIQATTSLGVLGVQVVIPLPEDHPMYAVVGRIASEWSHLEHLLDLIIWDLLDQHDRVRLACITSQLSGTESRVRAITTLLVVRGEEVGKSELLKSLNQIRQTANDISEGRHRAVHDPWYLETITGQPAQFKSMQYKKPQFGVIDIDATAQLKVIDDIRALNLRVATLRDQIQATPAPSGDMPPKGLRIGHQST